MDNTMWRIPSVNHPPPVSIDIWAQWSGLSLADLEGCRQRAIDGTFLSKIHAMGLPWMMSYFSMPCLGKYKCEEPFDIRVKLYGLPIDDSQHENHKAMLWNYHRLCFRCRVLLHRKVVVGMRYFGLIMPFGTLLLIFLSSLVAHLHTIVLCSSLCF